jgi:hypothetical protein
MFTLQSGTPPVFLNQIITDAAGSSKPPLYIDEYAVSVAKGVQRFTLEGYHTLLDRDSEREAAGTDKPCDSRRIDFRT